MKGTSSEVAAPAPVHELRPPQPGRQKGIVIATGLLIAIVSACSRGPAIQYVEGMVTLDGKPVQGAVVAFTPSGGGLAAAGTTDDAGVHKLNALSGRVGAGTLAGDYLVAVRKWEYPEGDQGPPPDPGDAEKFKAWQERNLKAARREPVYLTPKAYGEPATSGLKATVKKGRNTGAAFRFDLKSDFTGP